MKKLYGLLFLLIAMSLIGCGTKNVDVQQPELTGEMQELELTGDMTGDMEEIDLTDEATLLELSEENRENFDATEVKKVAGSEEVSERSGMMGEFQKLIDKRNTQPKDDTKLTEDDIDFMEKAIDFFAKKLKSKNINIKK